MTNFYKALDAYNDTPYDQQKEVEQNIWSKFGQTKVVLVLDMSGFSQLVQKHGLMHYLGMVRRMQVAIEPIVENRPVKGGASLTNDRSANLNESMIESIVGNKPIKEGSIGEKSANLEERMVEPIKDNRPANESGLGTNRGSQND